MDERRQIAKLQKRVESLEKELYTDELTRILNRRGLLAALKPLVETVAFQLQNPQKRKNVVIEAISILFIDIDHFKSINDTFGHPAGDEALKKVAATLRRGVRAIDPVGRWGGEEMIVGLIGADVTDAELIAETLRQKIESTEIVLERATMKVTASFGVATLHKAMSLDELIAKADEALYKAKKTGRNKVVSVK